MLVWLPFGFVNTSVDWKGNELTSHITSGRETLATIIVCAVFLLAAIKISAHGHPVLDLGKAVKDALQKQGMLAWQYSPPGVSDGITMGGEGMSKVLPLVSDH